MRECDEGGMKETVGECRGLWVNEIKAPPSPPPTSVGLVVIPCPFKKHNPVSQINPQELTFLGSPGKREHKGSLPPFSVYLLDDMFWRFLETNTSDSLLLSMALVGR